MATPPRKQEPHIKLSDLGRAEIGGSLGKLGTQSPVNCYLSDLEGLKVITRAMKCIKSSLAINTKIKLRLVNFFSTDLK